MEAIKKQISISKNILKNKVNNKFKTLILAEKNGYAVEGHSPAYHKGDKNGKKSNRSSKAPT